MAAALVLCLSALAALTLLPSPPPPHDLLASLPALFMSGASSASASLAASLVAGAVLVLIFCDKAAIVRHVRSMLGYAAAATAASPASRGQAVDAPEEASSPSSANAGTCEPVHRKRADVVSALSAPPDTDDTDEDFVVERRKRKNGPNIRGNNDALC